MTKRKSHGIFKISPLQDVGKKAKTKKAKTGKDKENSKELREHGMHKLHNQPHVALTMLTPPKDISPPFKPTSTSKGLHKSKSPVASKSLKNKRRSVRVRTPFVSPVRKSLSTSLHRTPNEKRRRISPASADVQRLKKTLGLHHEKKRKAKDKDEVAEVSLDYTNKKRKQREIEVEEIMSKMKLSKKRRDEQSSATECETLVNGGNVTHREPTPNQQESIDTVGSVNAPHSTSVSKDIVSEMDIQRLDRLFQNRFNPSQSLFTDESESESIVQVSVRKTVDKLLQSQEMVHGTGLPAPPVVCDSCIDEAPDYPHSSVSEEEDDDDDLNKTVLEKDVHNFLHRDKHQSITAGREDDFSTEQQRENSSFVEEEQDVPVAETYHLDFKCEEEDPASDTSDVISAGQTTIKVNLDQEGKFDEEDGDPNSEIFIPSSFEDGQRLSEDDPSAQENISEERRVCDENATKQGALIGRGIRAGSLHESDCTSTSCSCNEWIEEAKPKRSALRRIDRAEGSCQGNGVNAADTCMQEDKMPDKSAFTLHCAPDAASKILEDLKKLRSIDTKSLSSVAQDNILIISGMVLAGESNADDTHNESVRSPNLFDDDSCGDGVGESRGDKSSEGNISEDVFAVRDNGLDDTDSTGADIDRDQDLESELNSLTNGGECQGVIMRQAQKKHSKKIRKGSKLAKKGSKLTKKASEQTKKDSQLTKKDSEQTEKDSKLTKKDSEQTKKDSKPIKKGSKQTKMDSKQTKKNSKQTKKNSKQTKDGSKQTKKNSKKTEKDTGGERVSANSKKKKAAGDSTEGVPKKKKKKRKKMEDDEIEILEIIPAEPKAAKAARTEGIGKKKKKIKKTKVKGKEMDTGTEKLAKTTAVRQVVEKKGEKKRRVCSDAEAEKPAEVCSITDVREEDRKEKKSEENAVLPAKSILKSICGPIRGRERRTNVSRWRRLAMNLSYPASKLETVEASSDSVAFSYGCLKAAAKERTKRLKMGSKDMDSNRALPNDAAEEGPFIDYISFPDVIFTKKAKRPKVYAVPKEQIRTWAW